MPGAQVGTQSWTTLGSTIYIESIFQNCGCYSEGGPRTSISQKLLSPVFKKRQEIENKHSKFIQQTNSSNFISVESNNFLSWGLDFLNFLVIFFQMCWLLMDQRFFFLNWSFTRDNLRSTILFQTTYYVNSAPWSCVAWLQVQRTAETNICIEHSD